MGFDELIIKDQLPKLHPALRLSMLRRKSCGNMLDQSDKAAGCLALGYHWLFRSSLLHHGQVHITVRFIKLLAYNSSVDPQVNGMHYTEGNGLKAWVKKWTEPDLIPGLTPSFLLLHYANSLSEGL